MNSQMMMPVLSNVIKYLLEGMAVAGSAFYILPAHRRDVKEVATIGVVAALIMMILDMYAPGVAHGMRTGAGFGIGGKLVQWPNGA